MNKKKIYLISFVTVIVLTMYFTFNKPSTLETDVTYELQIKDFEDVVVSSGEILAKNSENINAPENLRQVGIWNAKIQDLVAEGTLVKAGDYVASLDRTEISNKIKDTQTELEKAESQFTQTQLDTTLNLRQTREEIKNLEYGLQQRKITLEQSAYEPPATIRQAQLELEKAERDLKQATDNYQIKIRQAKAKMDEVSASLEQIKRRLNNLVDLQGQFIINAPKDGMVIYMREWGGNKKKVGSSVSPWDPAVATLPDLSVLQSKTYVNEVDIRKVKVGQTVKVGLDAFPEVIVAGKVTSVANVGEQKGGSEAKVFEVMIVLLEVDSLFRPGMTSSNRIIANTKASVLTIPLEAIFYEDTLKYCYTKTNVGIERKEIAIAEANEYEAIVTKGLSAAEKVLLQEPEKGKEKRLTRLVP